MTSQSSLDLEEKQTSQLFTANVGAFNAIIHFLDDVRSEHEDQVIPLCIIAFLVLSQRISSSSAVSCVGFVL